MIDELRSTSPFPAEPQARAFAVQYTAVILIVLTFIIGSVTPKNADGGIVAATFIQGNQSEAHTIGIIRRARLFRGHTNNINHRVLDGVAGIVRAHDIEARFFIPSPKSSSISGLSRTRALYRALNRRKIKQQDFQISVIEVSRRFPVIRFYKNGTT